jgi:hypothetical protein
MNRFLLLPRRTASAPARLKDFIARYQRYRRNGFSRMVAFRLARWCQ